MSAWRHEKEPLDAERLARLRRLRAMFPPRVLLERLGTSDGLVKDALSGGFFQKPTRERLEEQIDRVWGESSP